LQEENKRSNHPTISYIFSVFIMIITIVVIIGIIHHFTISPYGPGLLIPIKEKYEEERKSIILAEARRLEELEEHNHFHIEVDYKQIPDDQRTVCFLCHSDFPHKKNKKVRALMNMHTQYFVCETCHIRDDDNMEIVYKWYSPFEENPSGPFFGTSYDPETGNLVEVEDKLSKIAPYFKKGDALESAIQMQDAPLARDYMKIRDKLTPEQRDGVKMKFHENVKPKGYDCKACHEKNGILDFKDLGFAENRISDLEQLNVKGMLTKYEEFYLPDLFLEPASEKP